MRVLIACEFSGVVRDAFTARGHDAFSCDLLPADGLHIQCDVRLILHDGWDLLIAHPPCTRLSVSGARWMRNKLPELETAIAFVNTLLWAPIPRICIENPKSILSTAIRKPDQIIQPYEFGEDAAKQTALWLVGLPPLKPTQYIPGRCVGESPADGRLIYRWGNQTDSGQNAEPDAIGRAARRSRTYPGIAEAMAAQWGCEPVTC